MTRRKTLALVGVLLAVGLVVFVPYRAWLYRGPGQLRDNGMLAYPRFQLELPAMTLGPREHRRVTFTGIPSEEMSLQLYVVGASRDDEAALKTARVEIVARLFEEATPTTPRREMCTAVGSPSGNFPQSQWVVTSSASHAALWHPRCLRMQMSSEGRYTLDVEITPTDALLPSKVLVPTLEGGGIELP